MIIYCTLNKINGKVYIGQDSKNNPDYFGSGKILKDAIKKYGNDNFLKIKLCECNSKKELNEKEIYYIKLFNSTHRNLGYNLTEGGGGILGYNHTKETKKVISKYSKERKLSKETKQKIGSKVKGKNNGMYGKDPWNKGKKGLQKVWNKGKTGIFSEESRKKIGDAHRGIPRKESIKKKISESHKGKKKSKEHCRNISKGLKLKLNIPFIIDSYFKEMTLSQITESYNETYKESVSRTAINNKLKDLNFPMAGFNSNKKKKEIKKEFLKNYKPKDFYGDEKIWD